MPMTYHERLEMLEGRRNRAWGRIKSGVSTEARHLGDRLNLPPLVRKHPFASVAAAAAAGGLLAFLWRNGRRVETQKVKVEVAVTDGHAASKKQGPPEESAVGHLSALLDHPPSSEQILQALALHLGADLAERYLPGVAEKVGEMAGVAIGMMNGAAAGMPPEPGPAAPPTPVPSASPPAQSQT
ncbi:MAG: hypothetical protein HYY93_09445 [Planctomycetes bacterium]|nr:hypothetical protein [Planctomycetota bacterium]